MRVVLRRGRLKKMNKRFYSALLFAALPGLFSLNGCTGVEPVWETTIEVTEEVGKAIKQNARVLYEVIRTKWRTVFPEWEGKVKIDPQNSLIGTYEGSIIYHVVDKGTKMSITYVLDNPIAEREREGADWILSDKNFPRGVPIPNTSIVVQEGTLGNAH